MTNVTINVKPPGGSWNDITKSVKKWRINHETNVLDAFQLIVENYEQQWNNIIVENAEVKFTIDTNDWFIGLITRKERVFKDYGEEIKINGLEYGCRLRDYIVYKTYARRQAGEIVKDLISLTDLDITTNNVENIDYISHIKFEGETVFEAIKKIARLVDGVFYVDGSKDLHFFAKGSSTTTITLTEGNNIKTYNLKRDMTGLKNIITVKGAKIGGKQIQYTIKDDTSISNYGEREKVIIDLTISDLSYAEAIAKKELEKSKDINIVGYIEAILSLARAGDNVDVKINSLGINESHVIDKVTHYSSRDLYSKVEFKGKIKTLSDILESLTDDIKKIERGLTSLRSATFSTIYVNPIFVDLIFYGPDFKSTSNVWFNNDGNLELTSGQTSGHVIFEVDVDEEGFLSWFNLEFDKEDNEGSITIDILDAADNIIKSGVSTPFNLLPYPSSLDACEANSEDYGVVNGFINSSVISAISTYSIKIDWTTSVDRYVYWPKTKDLKLDCSFHRYLHIFILQGSQQNVKIRLHTDNSNYFEKTLLFPESYVWREFKLELGDNLGWTSIGSPSWSNINYISIFLPSSDNVTEKTWIDGICFYPLLAETFKVKFNFSRSSASDQSPVFKKLKITYRLGVG